MKKPEAQFKVEQALFMKGRLAVLKEPCSSQPVAAASPWGSRMLEGAGAESLGSGVWSVSRAPLL